MNDRTRRLALGLLIVAVSAGCGKRGNPKAPIHPTPAAVTSLTARRIGDDIELRFTLPTENVDRTTPPAMTRIEVYGAAGPATVVAPTPMTIPVAALSIPVDGSAVAVKSTPMLIARFAPVRLSVPTGFVQTRAAKGPPPATTAQQILTKKHLRGGLEVRPPRIVANADEEPVEPEPEDDTDLRPKPGAIVTYTEKVATERAAAEKTSDVAVLRLIVVPMTPRKKQGTASAVLEIPLNANLKPPTDLIVDFDEKDFILDWTRTGPAQMYRVYLTNEAPDPDETDEQKIQAQKKQAGLPLNPAPLTLPTFRIPVVFAKERCFAVRSVLVKGPASTESDAVGPVCLTPVDTFPPLAPTGLQGLATEGQVRLEWNPVTALDLAGYLVLRGEDAASLQPLMTDPVSDTSYADTTVKPGAHYVWAVVAVDKAGNRSEPSILFETLIR